jgi:hypothetical protein
MLREPSVVSSEMTTTGLTFAAIPRSAIQTSPCRGVIAFQNIKNLLLHVPPGKNVRERLFLLLLLQETQIIPNLPKHRFRGAGNFLE